MKYPTLPELTAAHPEWRKAITLGDVLTLPMICVYSQRSPNYVLAAMRAKQLRATQTMARGTWQALLPDVQRWVLHMPPKLARTA